jgi:hypothetical protein
VFRLGLGFGLRLGLGLGLRLGLGLGLLLGWGCGQGEAMRLQGAGWPMRPRREGGRGGGAWGKFGGTELLSAAPTSHAVPCYALPRGASSAQVPEDQRSMSVEVALSVLGLEQHEVMWDREIDTKALICWGGDTIFIAFKGTGSRENVWTDLDVRGGVCGRATLTLAP